MSTTLPPAVGGHPRGAAATLRTDRWWTGPATTVAILSGFIIYSTWAALQGQHYYADPYLSPFYSPVLFTNQTVPGHAPLWHAWFGDWPAWWPAFVPASPALFILIFPGAFRFTCYYYRKAYYRGFAGSPPGCAVHPIAPSGKKYKGETGLLIFQNLHRYALYFAIAFIPILYFDAFISFFRKVGGEWKFGVGIGTFVLLANATFLACYTFGCHSFRHIIGGRNDCMSCGKRTLQYLLWRRATWLNEKHMKFAWLSLFWVALTDLYVRLVSMGVFTDLNTWD